MTGRSIVSNSPGVQNCQEPPTMYRECRAGVKVRWLSAINSELRIERVMKRDSVTREEVMNRMENQWTDDKKIALSDYVIDNNGDQMLLPQVLKIHEELTKTIKEES